VTASRKPAGTGVPSDRSPVPAAADWREQALCAGIGSWLFFPGTGHQQQAQVAKAVCRRCPVISPCLEFALEAEARPDARRHGIFGGTGPDEREAIARARKQEAA
jgi:WhiB family transcriptional regulator, redox-sensing transcriptional regulator